MKPDKGTKPRGERPRSGSGAGLLLCFAGLLGCAGCSALDVRSQSPEDEIESIASGVRLIGDLAVPFGTNPVSIESVGLVTGLPGTGSDPAPSPQRATLLAEMQARGVANPNQLLASTSTELVMVRGVLRPGIQKGDHFDVELRVPSRSECEGLRGGWLMQTRLKELALLGGSVHEGTVLGLAEGPVLVDPSAKDKVSKARGRVLGGGVSLTSRELGLVLKEPNFIISSQMGVAINRRFHTFSGGLKEGMAKPKTDEFVELKIHSRYKDNIERYIRVVRGLPLHETPKQQQARTQLLQRQLLDPITAATAAVRLEALGKDGIESLRKGLAASEEEVQFYAAEALAYLDQTEAAPVLGKLAHDVPAFRAYALAALSAMDDYAGYEALRDLLSVSSAETRYGAFRSLWAMNSRDTLVRGDNLGDQFSYHVLKTQGPPMIHVTGSYRPEVVLFGADQRLRNPLSIEAGSEIMINTLDEERVTVSRFSVNEPDQKRVVSTKVDDVIRAIVELGGSYPDVVQALQAAKSSGVLESRFEMDALPKGGRAYQRKSADGQDADEEQSAADGASDIVVGNPVPDLFSRRGYEEKGKAAKEKEQKDPDDDSQTEQKRSAKAEKRQPLRSFLGKMASRED